MKTSYAPSTDSLYIEARPLPSKRTDRGRDRCHGGSRAPMGEPVGYDIQHASMKPDVISRLIRVPAATE